MNDLVDLGFMDARIKLIDVAAFLDRVQRHGQEDDYRVRALREALSVLGSSEPGRARRILESLDVAFPLDSSVQHRFLEGLDDIGLTLKKADDIAAFEAKRPAYMPASR